MSHQVESTLILAGARIQEYTPNEILDFLQTDEENHDPRRYTKPHCKKTFVKCHETLSTHCGHKTVQLTLILARSSGHHHDLHAIGGRSKYTAQQDNY